MELIYPLKNSRQDVDDLRKQPSDIQQYFSGATVFVTGGTGFLGRLLIEKLLRTCTELRRIYILMRPKKNKSFEKRFEEYFDNVIYDLLKQKYPKAIEKVFPISGDCGLPDLGLTEKDKQILISEVNCIFHVAATVRFDEKIRTATHINVRGTRDLLRFAKKIKNLSAFVHVSTAFSFCPRQEIEEKFYEPVVTGEQLMTLVESFSEEKLDQLTPTLIGKWPNTYVFTKSVAEDVVKKEGAGLPVAVVRPSIVVATASEPIPGWIDNFYGATGVFAGAGIGLIRTLHCKPNNVADIVPADYVINSFIAAAWNIANVRSFTVNKEISDQSEDKKKGDLETDIPIYNYVSSPQKPLTWKQSMDMGFARGEQVSPLAQMWHHYLSLTPNRYAHLFLHQVLHMIPAYLIDFLAYCSGRQPRLVRGYSKIVKFLDVIAFFSSQEWLFRNYNTQKLWDKLNAEDKADFTFDMDSLDWSVYFHTYIPGIRMYVLKDPMDTLPQARSKAFKLKIAHYMLVGALMIGFLKLLMVLYNAEFY